MSTITFPGVSRIARSRSDNVPMESITDQPPTFACDMGKLTTHAWAIKPENGEIDQVAVMLQGWTSSADALSHLGRELVARTPGMAVVVLEHPRIPLLRNPFQLRNYLRHEAGPSAVRELRARTAETVGKRACKEFGLDSMSLIAHSLGSIDAINTAVSTDIPIDSLTALAPAGLLKPGEARAALLRAPRAFCGPRTGFIGDLVSQNPFQIVSEATVGLRERVENQLASLGANGVRLAGIDFANDHLFIRNGNPGGFDDFQVIHEGCACHNAATHPTESARIASALHFEQLSKLR